MKHSEISRQTTLVFLSKAFKLIVCFINLSIIKLSYGHIKSNIKYLEFFMYVDYFGCFIYFAG